MYKHRVKCKTRTTKKVGGHKRRSNPLCTRDQILMLRHCIEYAEEVPMHHRSRLLIHHLLFSLHTHRGIPFIRKSWPLLGGPAISLISEYHHTHVRHISHSSLVSLSYQDTSRDCLNKVASLAHLEIHPAVLQNEKGGHPSHAVNQGVSN